MVKKTKDHNFRIFLLISAVFLTGFALWAVHGVSISGYSTLDSPVIVVDNAIPSIQEDLTIQSTSVSTCRDLNVSGETYLLTTDLVFSSTCFRITNNSVTLDCQGHNLNSTGYDTINVTGYSNVSVKNCNIFQISDIGYWETGAIHFASSNGGNITNNSINSINSLTGIYVESSNNLKLQGNRLIYNPGGRGIFIEQSTSINLSNNNVTVLYQDDGEENADLGPINITRRDSSSISLNWSTEGFPAGLNYSIKYVELASGTCSDIDNINGSISTISVGNSTNGTITGLSPSTPYAMTACVDNPEDGLTYCVERDSGVIVSTTSSGSENFPSFLTCPNQPDSNQQGNAILVEGNNVQQFTHNIDTTNVLKKFPGILPIYYYGGSGSSPSCPNNQAFSSPNASEITFIGCSNVTVRDFGYSVTFVNTSSPSLINSSVRGAMYGTRVLFGSHNATLEENNFYEPTTGISLISSSAANLTGNKVISLASHRFEKGLELSSSSNNDLFNNNITALNRNNTGYGLVLVASPTNNFTDNNFIVNDLNSEDISFTTVIHYSGGGSNNNAFRNTLLGLENNSGTYIKIGSGNSDNSYINTTFSAQNNNFDQIYNTASSVRFPGTFTLPASISLGEISLLNSGNLYIHTEDAEPNFFRGEVSIDTRNVCPINASFLDMPAVVTFNNITFNNNSIFIDQNDSGIFEECNSPECNNLSFSGGTFIFNVSHFTTYSSDDSRGENPLQINITERTGTTMSFYFNKSIFRVPFNGTIVYAVLPNASQNIDGDNLVFGTQDVGTAEHYTVIGLSPSTYYLFLYCLTERLDLNDSNGDGGCADDMTIALTTPGGTEAYPQFVSFDDDSNNDPIAPAGFSGNFSSSEGVKYNSRDGDEAKGIDVDNAGNVYVAGKASQGAFCYENSFMVKYDSAGNVLNYSLPVTTYSAQAIMPKADNLGNVYFARYDSGLNIRIVKYNSTFDLVASSSDNYIPSSITVDSTGNSVFLLRMSGSGQEEITIDKYNSSLFLINSTIIANVSINGPITGSAVGILRGQKDGDVVYDNNSNSIYVVATDILNSKVFIANYDTNLSLIKNITYGWGNIKYKGHGIAISPVTGEIYVTATFGNGTENIDDGWDRNHLDLIRFDSSLNYISNKTFMGDQADIDVDSEGDIYIAGDNVGPFRLSPTSLEVVSCIATSFEARTSWIRVFNSSAVYFSQRHNANCDNNAYCQIEIFNVIKADLSNDTCLVDTFEILPTGPGASPSSSSGGGGGGGSSAAAPNVTVCQEDWQCEEVGACVDGKQSMKCVDNNACGTTTFKPGESKPCAAHTATPNVPAVPSPAPSTSMWTIVLALIAALMIVSVITMSSIVVAQKRKLAGQLYEVIGKANASLSMGDKASALNNYKVLREYFTKYQNKVMKKDLQKIHGEAMRLYEQLTH